MPEFLRDVIVGLTDTVKRSGDEIENPKATKATKTDMVEVDLSEALGVIMSEQHTSTVPADNKVDTCVDSLGVMFQTMCL